MFPYLNPSLQPSPPKPAALPEQPAITLGRCNQCSSMTERRCCGEFVCPRPACMKDHDKP